VCVFVCAHAYVYGYNDTAGDVPRFCVFDCFLEFARLHLEHNVSVFFTRLSINHIKSQALYS
jgi:hypothetical protein